MREFELLANEEQIRDMAREFASVRVRGELLNKAAMPRQKPTIANNETTSTQPPSDVSNVGNAKKSSDVSAVINAKTPQMPSDGVVSNAKKSSDVSNVSNAQTPQTPREACREIERAYLLERESEQMALRLYSLAPSMQKDELAEIIKIKRANIKRLNSEYERVANKALNFSPRAYNCCEYCEALLKLSQCQSRLLACLALNQCCQALKDITNTEIIVATTLNRLAIFS